MATSLFNEGLTVHTQSHDYPIVITDQCDMAEQVAPYISGQQVLIVTNETVAPLYLQQLQEQLAKSFKVAVCSLPDGEQYKNQASINQIYDALMAQHFNRVIAT